MTFGPEVSKMKQVTFEGTVAEYQGKPVSPELKFSGSADQYENISEARGSEDWLSDAEILKAINAKKVTAAKSSAYQGVIKPLKDAYEASAEFKFDNIVKSAMAAGATREQAEGVAASLVPGVK